MEEEEEEDIHSDVTKTISLYLPRDECVYPQWVVYIGMNHQLQI